MVRNAETKKANRPKGRMQYLTKYNVWPKNKASNMAQKMKKKKNSSTPLKMILVPPHAGPASYGPILSITKHLKTLFQNKDFFQKTYNKVPISLERISS